MISWRPLLAGVRTTDKLGKLDKLDKLNLDTAKSLSVWRLCQSLAPNEHKISGQSRRKQGGLDATTTQPRLPAEARRRDNHGILVRWANVLGPSCILHPSQDPRCQTPNRVVFNVGLTPFPRPSRPSIPSHPQFPTYQDRPRAAKHSAGVPNGGSQLGNASRGRHAGGGGLDVGCWPVGRRFLGPPWSSLVLDTLYVNSNAYQSPGTPGWLRQATPGGPMMSGQPSW